VTRGGASTPPHRIAPDESREQQRHVSNPELVVEVRGGKIYGIRSEVPR